MIYDTVLKCTEKRIICVFFNDTATTEIYTLSLHDALPIWFESSRPDHYFRAYSKTDGSSRAGSHDRRRKALAASGRSEEHTSELQSRQYLVCRLLLEKKKSSMHLSNHIAHPTRRSISGNTI